MIPVVSGGELLAEEAGVLDRAEPAWEGGTVLQRLETRFNVRVVHGGPGPGAGRGHAQADEESGQASWTASNCRGDRPPGAARGVRGWEELSRLLWLVIRRRPGAERRGSR